MTDDSAVERFFAEYGDLHQAVLEWRLAYAVVKRLLCPLSGRTVLDYGCGDGRFARLLRDRGARVIAVDTCADSILLARQKSTEKIAYHVIESGDLRMIPRLSLDLAVSTFVLCTIQQRAEVGRVLQAIYERLKPGGCYVLCEPHPDAVAKRFYSSSRTVRGETKPGAMIDVKLLGGGGTTHEFWRPREEYVALLTDAGFVVEHVISPTMADYPDEPFWKDERSCPPFINIRVRK